MELLLPCFCRPRPQCTNESESCVWMSGKLQPQEWRCLRYVDIYQFIKYWGWISLTKLAKLQVELWYYAGDLSSLQAVASSMHLTLSDNITGSGAARYVADTMCILNDSWLVLAAYNFLAFSEVMTALAIPVNSLWQNYYFRSYTMCDLIMIYYWTWRSCKAISLSDSDYFHKHCKKLHESMPNFEVVIYILIIHWK